MNYLKSIAAGAIAIFLLIGTIGVNVFSHFCEEDGLEVSYFVPNEEICGTHEHESTPQADDCDDCCCDEKEDDRNDCCSTSTEFVKVHLDYLNQWVAKAIITSPSDVTPVWDLETVLVSSDVRIASGSDPPPKRRKDLLTDIQKWLI